MDNTERAERARQAFDASPHARENNDETTNLYDLVCDLLHLADRVVITETDHPGAAPADTNGEYVARMGLWHYREELAEEADDAEAEAS